MRALSGAWRFVAGDDPVVAAGVAAVLGLTAAGSRLGADPWWLVAAAVPALVLASLRRAVRRRA